MIDLVTSHDGDDFVGSVSVNGKISDHAIVDIKLAISKPRVPKKKRHIPEI